MLMTLSSFFSFKSMLNDELMLGSESTLLCLLLEIPPEKRWAKLSFTAKSGMGNAVDLVRGSELTILVMFAEEVLSPPPYPRKLALATWLTPLETTRSAADPTVEYASCPAFSRRFPAIGAAVVVNCPAQAVQLFPDEGAACCCTGDWSCTCSCFSAGARMLPFSF